jgi:hypothetical protein
MQNLEHLGETDIQAEISSLSLHDLCDSAVNPFRSEFASLNLALAKAHLPCEVIDAAPEYFQQNAMCFLFLELLLSATQEHQLVPLFLEKCLTWHDAKSEVRSAAPLRRSRFSNLGPPPTLRFCDSAPSGR